MQNAQHLYRVLLHAVDSDKPRLTNGQLSSSVDMPGTAQMWVTYKQTQMLVYQIIRSLRSRLAELVKIAPACLAIRLSLRSKYQFQLAFCSC